MLVLVLSVINVKVLVGAFSVIVKYLREPSFEALVACWALEPEHPGSGN